MEGKTFNFKLYNIDREDICFGNFRLPIFLKDANSVFVSSVLSESISIFFFQ